jgi:hypothetical protein
VQRTARLPRVYKHAVRLCTQCTGCRRRLLKAGKLPTLRNSWCHKQLRQLALQLLGLLSCAPFCGHRCCVKVKWRGGTLHSKHSSRHAHVTCLSLDSTRPSSKHTQVPYLLHALLGCCCCCCCCFQPCRCQQHNQQLLTRPAASTQQHKCKRQQTGRAQR